VNSSPKSLQNVSKEPTEVLGWPDMNLDHLDPKADYDKSNTPTLDVITQSSREKKKKQQSVLASIASEGSGSPEAAPLQSESEPTSAPSASDPASLEDEASSEGAFNPATGEINWDCPCLGGMAHGPCGGEFRAAFSCFVFSEEEPKGMDCIDKFKGMQDCFRAHPDVYAAELEGDDDEELDDALEEERKGMVKEIKERREKAGTASAEPVHEKRLLEVDPPMERKPLLRRPQAPPSSPPATPAPSSTEPHPPMSEDHEADARAKGKPLPAKRQPESNPDKAAKPEVFDQDLELMPKEWHDSHAGTNSTKKTEK
jgi:mitochondrial intermembrane space import and assembly protein 40